VRIFPPNPRSCCLWRVVGAPASHERSACPPKRGNCWLRRPSLHSSPPVPSAATRLRRFSLPLICRHHRASGFHVVAQTTPRSHRPISLGVTTTVQCTSEKEETDESQEIARHGSGTRSDARHGTHGRGAGCGGRDGQRTEWGAGNAR